MIWVVILTLLLTPLVAWLWSALFVAKETVPEPVRGRRLLSAEEVANAQEERLRRRETPQQSDATRKGSQT
jgi:hypothetical protein